MATIKLDIQYFGLALSALRRFYKSFYFRFVEDSYQIAALAALEAEGIENLKHAARIINATLHEEVRNAGFIFDSRLHRWLSPEVHLSDFYQGRAKACLIPPMKRRAWQKPLRFDKKLDEQKLKMVRNMLALGATPEKVSRETGIDEETVKIILYNTSWNL